ncbi:hypothetical protein FF2_009254 [Malus domestica]
MAVMKRLPGRGPNSVGDGRTALFTSTLKGWPSRRCLSYLKPFFCQSLSVSRDLNGLSGHDHREENLAGCALKRFCASRRALLSLSIIRKGLMYDTTQCQPKAGFSACSPKHEPIQL